PGAWPADADFRAVQLPLQLGKALFETGQRVDDQGDVARAVAPLRLTLLLPDLLGRIGAEGRRGLRRRLLSAAVAALVAPVVAGRGRGHVARRLADRAGVGVHRADHDVAVTGPVRDH